MDFDVLAEEFVQTLCRRPAGKQHAGKDTMHGEVAVLRYLTEVKNPALPSEISSHLQLTTARIANILANLEKKGLVERKQDEKDRRKVYVHMTEAGAKVSLERRSCAISSMRELLEALGEEDAAEYVRLEKKVTEVILEKRRQEIEGSIYRC